MKSTSRLIMAALLLGTASCSSNEAAENTMNVDENLTTEVADNATAEAPGNEVFCDVVEARTSVADCDDLKHIDSQVKEGAAAFNVPSPMTRDKPKAVMLVVDRRAPEIIAAIEAGTDGNATATDETMNAVENMDADVNVSDTVDMNAVEAEPEPGAGQNEVAEGPNPNPPAEGPTPGQIVAGLEGTTKKITPKVGRFMSADLTGDGFKIEPLSDRSQEIPPNSQATWQWNVTPLQGGAHSLTLKTIVEGEVGGKRYPLSRTQTVATVEVEVSWLGWLWDFLSGLPEWLKLLATVGSGLAVLIFTGHQIRKAWKGEKPDKA